MTTFTRYNPPKYTKYKGLYSNIKHKGIYFEEVCRKCGFRMGDHMDIKCPNSSTHKRALPEFFIIPINKNITVL
jgi:hypothetical protein